VNRLPAFLFVSLSVCLLAGAVGCAKKTAPASPEKAAEPARAAEATKAVEPVKAPEPVKAAEPEKAAEPVKAAPTPGAQTFGEAFAGAPAATVIALRSKPEEYVGKKVALEGPVSAMCEHKRKWLSIADAKTGQYVRVFTAPAFLVPAGSVGKNARAEGTVEKVEVPAAYAKHMAAKHKLGDPADITGEVFHDLIVRATSLEVR
jgi:hypothetical protein